MASWLDESRRNTKGMSEKVKIIRILYVLLARSMNLCLEFANFSSVNKKSKEQRKSTETNHTKAPSASDPVKKDEKHSINKVTDVATNSSSKAKTKHNVVKTGESALEIKSTANKVTISKTDKKLVDLPPTPQAASGKQSIPSTFSSSLTITPVDNSEATVSKPLPIVPNKVFSYPISVSLNLHAYPVNLERFSENEYSMNR